jgi:hypothetical protein
MVNHRKVVKQEDQKEAMAGLLSEDVTKIPDGVGAREHIVRGA